MGQIKCQKCGMANKPNVRHCAQCGATLASAANADAAAPQGKAPVTFQRGQKIAKRYSVLRLVGRGGMGCIYLVYDNVLKEEVALKTLLPQFIGDRLVVERFLNEAKIARQLSHPNIVRVHDIGMSHGVVYISMQYLRGRSLRETLEHLPPGKRLPVDEVLRIFDNLCAALEYAHKHTVHRDIKPENVMIGEDGSVNLMDFGISKLVGNPALTSTSMVMGTPFYMSPEQLRNSKGVDARADVYSMGVMLYEVLTGMMPSGMLKPASSMGQNVPPVFDPLIAKCVEPKPCDRYQNASELRQALRTVARQHAVPAVELGGPLPQGLSSGAPVAEAVRGGWPKKGLGVVCALLVMALSAWGVWEVQQLKRARSGVEADAVKAAGGKQGLKAMAARYETLEQVAKQRYDAMTREERHVYDDSAVAWKQAQARQDQDAAWRALCGMAALTFWPEGMTYISPGSVTLYDGNQSQQIEVGPFFIDLTEVTNEDYAVFCRSYPEFVANSAWRHNPPEDVANLPATDLTFYQVQAYAAWARKELPSEAQWARAAYGIADSEQDYPWGNEVTSHDANFWGQADEGDGYAYAAPVGAFEADTTAQGCLDMAGNVSEWTCSLHRPLPRPDSRNPDDAASLFFGAPVVTMGGSYATAPVPPKRSRGYIGYAERRADLGFRCVWKMPGTAEELDLLLEQLQ